MTNIPGPMRIPPLLTELNRDYWTGGLNGELRIQRCQACGLWHHPPTTVCRRCLSRDLRAQAVSGKGTVAAFTINHQQWSPSATPDPYVIAIVELAEQAGLRQTTNIVNCPVREVYIGMPVRVLFEPLADVAVPVFEPDR
ncbi:MAG: Zn-ribbon domain-containing OB-fold protein [Gammaproteobacteria bacterium]